MIRIKTHKSGCRNQGGHLEKAKGKYPSTACLSLPVKFEKGMQSKIFNDACVYTKVKSVVGPNMNDRLVQRVYREMPLCLTVHIEQGQIIMVIL